MTVVIDYPSPVPLSRVSGGDRQTEKALHRSIRAFLRDGGTIWRDRGRVLLRHDKQDRATVLAASLEALERLCVPAVTEEQAALTRAVLEAAGASVAYVDDPEAAAFAVLELRDEYRAELAEHGRAVIGLDMETEVLLELRGEVLVKFTQAGAVAKRQPKEGAAGLALDPYSSRVRLCQLWAGYGAVRAFDMRAVPWSVLDLLLDDPSINWAAFAATFEAKRLLVERGRMPAGRLYDTRTAVWLTHGKLPDLEEAARLVFGLTVPKVLGASDWSADTLTHEQIEYAALDAVLAAALWHNQRNYFEADDPEAEIVQRVADNAIEAVARAELHGVGFDRDTHARMVAGWQAELQEHEAARATAVPGFDWRNRQALQDHLTANLSEAELDHWPRTKTGLLGTRRTTLVQAKHVAGITEHLEVKRLAKLLDTYGETLPAKINPRTGRLHTSLLIAGARSGRFSSRGPNLQQCPKRRSRDFRSVIVAGEGKLLLAADYSQIELRAGAEIIYAAVGYSGLRDGFQAGLDAHRTTAMHLTGKNDPDTVTKDERDQAKAPNFGLQYGMRERGFFFYVRDQYQPDITEAEAFDLYDAAHAAYPELAEWHAFQEAQCRADGYVSTPLGRRWSWHWLARDEDEIDYDRGFIEDQRSGFHRNYAFNHPIQGGCAEVILLATARVDRALRGLPARITLTVHDELVLELVNDPQVIADVRTIVVQEMTAAFLHVFPDAPTLGLVEPTIGRSWGEQVPVDDWLKGGSN
jgi:DNA polymerase I-like protein with 3'-5' exonuclease and polymerase domains